MRIPWKIKSAAFAITDRLNAPSLLYFFQKNVTKNSRSNLTAVGEDWGLHRENFADLRSPRLIEFGAGKDLRQNLHLFQFCTYPNGVSANSLLT